MNKKKSQLLNGLVAGHVEFFHKFDNTTDELYISEPYFTLEEAAQVKGTIVPSPILTEIPEFEELEFEGGSEHHVGLHTPALGDEGPKEATVETAIKSCFQSFFEKRKASGDVRPCGPHDMGPIYRAIFMIS
ncbi:hypothetical protein BPOR_0427g00070 [Botrytis porri]|uniref:Uncharacterized protein n=1 Tax=Botrytis porri TaxID=87229 RepID=A0A4Z1KGG0_9HELO|nr:hypothetical protein BPOR_0427g00070 [Botrytis porri]